MIPRLVFIAITVGLLVFALWREARLLKTTLTEHRYLGVLSEVFIFGSVDFLVIVFLSYQLGMVLPALGVLSGPNYVRFGLSGLLLGLTVSWVGQAAVEARQSFLKHNYPRFAISLTLAVVGAAAAVLVYFKFLRT
jgi:hypothetical protein